MKNILGIEIDFRNLQKTGLSMTQAQSVSNICNQKVTMLLSKFDNIQNFSSQIEYNGKTVAVKKGNAVPADIKETLTQIGELSALQGYLMENIKAKVTLMNVISDFGFEFEKAPDYPEMQNRVDEAWGLAQLTTAEKGDFIFHEAMAAKYGQFIHKNGLLTSLRANLKKDSELEFIELKRDEKIPIEKTVFHTPEQLLEIHESLAVLHREHEQKLNYLKAKIKNLVSDENVRIQQRNQELQSEFQGKFQEWSSKRDIEQTKGLKEVAALRIFIIDLFKPQVDELLKGVEEKESTN